MRITKVTSKIGVSWTLSLPFCFWPICSSMNYVQKDFNKYQNDESHSSLKLSFTNIWGLSSNFVKCKSFPESNSPDILALCKTKLGGSVDSGNLSVRVYLPLNPKSSITDMHGLAVYVREGLPFPQELSLENYVDFYLFLAGFTSLHVLLLSLYQSPSLPPCTVFEAIYLT